MTDTQPSFTNKFIIVIVLLLLSIGIVWVVFNNSNSGGIDDFKIDLSLQKVCSYINVTNGNEDCTPDGLLSAYPDEIASCYNIHDKASTVEQALLWVKCLELEGADLGI